MSGGIVEYNLVWPKLFNKEKAFLIKLFGDEIGAIEHIGSTAIPKQRAKPIIDIFLAVKELKEKEYYERKLPQEYIYLETGMKNRYLFNKKGDEECYNVHIMSFGEEFRNRNEILFRDYLRDHPQLVEEYGRLKDELIHKHGISLEYTQGKTRFIQLVVDQARKEKGLPPRDVWE